jgi:hypothetical protein
MRDGSILDSPADATSEWASELFARDVAVLASEPIADAGIISAVARLRLAGESVPASVIVKCAPSDDDWRARVNELGLLRTEAHFYSEIGSDCGMPVPGCWYSSFRASDGRCTIVLEDLDPLVPGDNSVGLSRDEAFRAVGLLPPMHARFWGRADRWSWLVDRGRIYASGATSLPGLVEAVLERYGDRLAEPIVRLLPQLDVAIIGSFDGALNTAHQTLVHGDFHAGNIAFGADPRHVKVFDWQLAMSGSPGADLVKLVFNSLTVGARREFGEGLIEAYIAGMGDLGVRIDRSDLDRLIKHDFLHRLGATTRIAARAEGGSHTEGWMFLCMDRWAAAIEDGWCTS